MVRMNGTEIRGLSLKYDGAILTLTGRDMRMTLPQFAQILSDNPTFEVVEAGSVKGIYKGLEMRTMILETLAGVHVITASMAARAVDVPEPEGPDMRKEVEEIRSMVQAALDAVMAMEEGMADV